jgi:hypothetical protein
MPIELGKLKIGSKFKSGLGVYTLLGGVITEYEEERKPRKAKLVEAPPGFTFVQDSYGDWTLRPVTLVVEYLP